MAAAAAAHAKKQKVAKKRAEDAQRTSIAYALLQRSSRLFRGFSQTTVTPDDDGVEPFGADAEAPPTTIAEAAGDRPAYAVGWRYYQPEAEWLYQHIYIQVFVAILIMGNFAINIIEAQVGTNGYARDNTVDWQKKACDKNEKGSCEEAYDKSTTYYFKRQEGSHLYNTMQVFIGFEEFFFYAFLLELALNMYSCATGTIWKFWGNGWNIFDFFIVSITVLFKLESVVTLPSYLMYLRLLRAFRVFRLFKRVKSLNKIIVSLGRATPGVSNAFLILLLVMCIYAILGVELFSQLPCGVNHSDGPGSCTELNNWHAANSARLFDGTDKEWKHHFTHGKKGTWYEGDPNGIDPPPQRMCSKEAAPGYGIVKPCRIQYHYGQEYWGNFFKALYTLFQVLTGESWSEAVARPLLEWSPVPTAIYFVSFMLLNGIVLINVVVAVLLEKMVDDEEEDEEEEEEGAAPAAPGEEPHHHHPKHLTVGQVYAERKADRENMEARMDKMQAQMARMLELLGEKPGAIGVFDMH